MFLSKTRTRRDGASAVEFAMIAPMLLLLIFGMVECSRFMMALHATTGAARVAARAATVRHASEEDIASAAIDYLKASSFKTDSVEVFIEESESSVSGMIGVSCTVTIPFSDVSVIGDPLNLSVDKVSGNSSTLTEGSIGDDDE